MTNKLILASLMGASQAALCPLPGSATAWPAYDTPATLAATDLTTNNIKASWSEQSSVTVGPIRGFRSNLLVAVTQNIVGAVQATAGSRGSLATQSTTRSFWQLTLTLAGTYEATVALIDTAPNAQSSQSVGAHWILCQEANKALISTCNAITFNKTDGSHHNLPYRIMMKVNTDTAITMVTALVAITWKEEFVMASFYHPIGTALAASTWCTTFLNTVAAADTAPKDMQAGPGFNGKSKCNWQVKTNDGDVAPAINMTTASYNTISIQWVDWLTAAGLGTNGLLKSTADAANYFIGQYATADGTFFNPITTLATVDATGGILASNTVWGYESRNPNDMGDGSVGTAAFFSQQSGPLSETFSKKITVDSWVLQNQVSLKKAEYAAYQTKIDEYTTKKTAFTDAVKLEKDRIADFFNSLFTPATKMPKLLPIPYRPGMISGPILDLANGSKTSPVAWPTTTATITDFGFKAYLQPTTTTYAPAVAFANKSGFLHACKVAATTPGAADTDVSHAFGKLGQGPLAGAKPFYWGTTATANTPGIMVGLYPAADADTGPAASTTVTVQASAAAWAAQGEWDAPAAPTAPTDVTDEDRDIAAQACRALPVADQGEGCGDDYTLGKFKGAAHLQMGIAALGLVAATLY